MKVYYKIFKQKEHDISEIYDKDRSILSRPKRSNNNSMIKSRPKLD